MLEDLGGAPTGPDVVQWSGFVPLLHQARRRAVKRLPRAFPLVEGEDIEQEVIVQLLRRLESQPDLGWKADRGEFRAYLYRLLVNHCRSAVRQLLRLYPPYAGESDWPGGPKRRRDWRVPTWPLPPDIVSREENGRERQWLVREAVEKLGEPQRTVINHWVVLGWTLKEIACELGMTTGKVFQIKEEGLLKLRQGLKELKED